MVLAIFYLRPATRITPNKARSTYLYPIGLAHKLKGNSPVAGAENLRQRPSSLPYFLLFPYFYRLAISLILDFLSYLVVVPLLPLSYSRRRFSFTIIDAFILQTAYSEIVYVLEGKSDGE